MCPSVWICLFVCPSVCLYLSVRASLSTFWSGSRKIRMVQTSLTAAASEAKYSTTVFDSFWWEKFSFTVLTLEETKIFRGPELTKSWSLTCSHESDPASNKLFCSVTQDDQTQLHTGSSNYEHKPTTQKQTHNPEVTATVERQFVHVCVCVAFQMPWLCGDTKMMEMIEKKRILCREIKARQRPEKNLCKQDSMPILPSWKRKQPPPYSAPPTATATGHTATVFWDTAIWEMPRPKTRERDSHRPHLPQWHLVSYGLSESQSAR